jgi:preprotein translocase subunit SecG
VETLRTVLYVIFVIDAILLVIAVLIQSGRGGGLAGALGGIGGADSALGVRAASQIEKATGVMAGIFLIIALLLGLTAGGQDPDNVDADTGERGVYGATGGTTTPAKNTSTPKTSDPAKVGKTSEAAATKAGD